MDARRQILVVDDEPGPRESLRRILTHEFDVQTTARGSQALEWLRGGGYEVVLLDLAMPEDLSGAETLQAIRARDLDVETIVISGQQTIETAVACMRLGAYDYIVKPYDPSRVIGSVQSAIAARSDHLSRRGLPLADLSHKLRTPIHAIIGYAEILHDEIGALLTPDQNRALARIRSNCERLLSDLNHLFFLSQTSRGELPGEPRDFTVRDWLLRLLNPLKRQAEEMGSSLAIRCAPDLIGRSHPETLERLLAVLIQAALCVRGDRVCISARRTPRGRLTFAIDHRATFAGSAPYSRFDELCSSIQDSLEREVATQARGILGAEIRTRYLPGERKRLSIDVAAAPCPAIVPRNRTAPLRAAL